MLVSSGRCTNWSGFISAAAAIALISSCSTPPKVPQTFPDESGGPLSNVILLPLTTRSTDGLLGHAWDVETDLADPLRIVLSGTEALTSTDQHVTFFRDVSAHGELDANFGLGSAGVWASHVTHVVYDVQITALATIAAGTQRYNADSGCCLQGAPTESCESGYVYRLLRGSGTIRMLQRLEGQLSVGVKEFIVARGGTRYRVVDESTFGDAYFGLELSPLQSVCRTLTPEQEMAPLRLLAPPNCIIQRYAALGEKETLARQLPNEELCRSVARRYCSELSGVISCRVRFGTMDELDLTSSSTTPAQEAAAAKFIAPGKTQAKSPPAPPAGTDRAAPASTQKSMQPPPQLPARPSK